MVVQDIAHETAGGLVEELLVQAAAKEAHRRRARISRNPAARATRLEARAMTRRALSASSVVVMVITLGIAAISDKLRK